MLVVDIETTALDPAKAAITSIGAVDLSDPARRFHRVIRVPQLHMRGIYVGPVQIEDIALSINGERLDDIFGDHRPPLGAVIEEFDSWSAGVENITIAGENVGNFDAPFLRHAYDRLKRPWLHGHRFIDMHSIAAATILRANRHALPLKDRRSALDSATIHVLVGLPDEPRPHDALRGALWEAESLHRLIWGVGLLTDFQHLPVPPLGGR